jgi:hypothetical protein
MSILVINVKYRPSRTVHAESQPLRHRVVPCLLPSARISAFNSCGVPDGGARDAARARANPGVKVANAMDLLYVYSVQVGLLRTAAADGISDTMYSVECTEYQVSSACNPSVDGPHDVECLRPPD